MRISHLYSKRTERLLKLPPPITRDLRVERGLKIPMRDGTVLLGERWMPRSGGNGLPTALLRSPYPLKGALTNLVAKPLAERGYQVVMQFMRGIGGSEGNFELFNSEQERLDGLDTIDWVCKQSWFGDSIVLFGPSYHGFVQWAMADELPSQVKAMVPAVTSSAMAKGLLHGDVFSLESALGWAILMEYYKGKLPLLQFILNLRRISRSLSILPLSNIDNAIFGHRSEIMHDILTYPDSPLWEGADVSERVTDVVVPTSIISGWYDVFLMGTLQDYKHMQDAGRSVRLTIGNWDHNSPEISSTTIKELLQFGMAYVRGETPEDRAPVRVFVMGAEKWRDFLSWPPPGYQAQRLYLQPTSRLAAEEPPSSGPDSYRYDPADPTPAIGGQRLLPGSKAGRVNNASLESRPDVLVYTSDTLTEDLEIIGEVSAEIWFKSSLPYADVFVRVCDVDPSGCSINVCDGLSRLNHADELTCASVTLSPTAFLFRRGHQIRIQVSSGAFPQYNRNPGTGEPWLTATQLRAAKQQVYHDPEHPSAIVLPVRVADSI